jgi:hypothetical protein
MDRECSKDAGEQECIWGVGVEASRKEITRKNKA